MKLLLVFAVGAVMQVYSLPSSAKTAENEVSMCDLVETMAETFMDARQGGVTLRRSMEIFANNKDDGPMSTLLEGILLDAYEAPAYSSEAAKQREIKEFSNKWYLLCLKTKRGR